MSDNPDPNRVRLQHMLDAAHKIGAFAADTDRESLDDDEMRQLALTRLIEIIGEAATQITDDFYKAHPHIPWAAMRGMRNRLIHAYFDVNLDILWETVTVSIPALIPQLEAILDDKDNADELS